MWRPDPPFLKKETECGGGVRELLGLFTTQHPSQQSS